MNKYITRTEYNQLKKELTNFQKKLKFSSDEKMIENSKSFLTTNISELLGSRYDDHVDLLSIDQITEPGHVDHYLNALQPFVKDMIEISDTKLKKIFKKEKKLKLPNASQRSADNVYLGWVNHSIRKLYIAYEHDNQVLGMACHINPSESNHTNCCTLCNHFGKANEVAFVSSICKGSSQEYRSIGFSVCLDSRECNKRITSMETLKSLLLDVNGLD